MKSYSQLIRFISASGILLILMIAWCSSIVYGSTPQKAKAEKCLENKQETTKNNQEEIVFNGTYQAVVPLIKVAITKVHFFCGIAFFTFTKFCFTYIFQNQEFGIKFRITLLHHIIPSLAP